MSEKFTELFDLKIFCRSKRDFLSYIEKKIVGKNLTTVFTPNAEQIVQAQKNSDFKKNLQQADVLIPDGMSLVWAFRLLNFMQSERQDKNQNSPQPIKERIAGVDVVKDLLKSAKKKKWKVLVVGGRGLGSKNNHFYWTAGYESIKNPTKKEEEKVSQIVKKIQPQIVFVAFGAPFQEKWVINHRDLLEKNGVKIVMVVGGAFDFISGKVRRAPKWMRKIGLEWLYRLIQEPWRWRRQLRLLEFWGRVATNWWSEKIQV